MLLKTSFLKKEIHLSLPPPFSACLVQVGQRQRPTSPPLSLPLTGRARLSAIPSSPTAPSHPTVRSNHRSPAPAPTIPPTPRASAAFEERQKPEPSRSTALIRSLFHSRFLGALAQTAARRPRLRPSLPPFFALVSSAPLPLPPCLFFS